MPGICSVTICNFNISTPRLFEVASFQRNVFGAEMSKSHGNHSKSQPQLATTHPQHFSLHNKGKSKADTCSVATDGAQPLTLDMLIGELEKLCKDVTDELTTSLNTKKDC